MPFILLLCGYTTACSAPAGSLQDLVYDKNASNVAVLFGVPDNLPGVRVDMRELEALFQQPEYGLKVYSYLDKNPAEIAQLTGQHSKEVDANGTLLFYFSGHGAEDGLLMAYGGMLDFNDVASAIKQNRTAPLKRLLTVVDSCFSGNLVNGNVAISNTGGPQTATDNRIDGTGQGPGNGGFWSGILGLRSDSSQKDFRIYEQEYSEPLNDLTNANIFAALSPYAGTSRYGLQTSTLYEQVLVLSSSRKTELSADTKSGGAFTTGFRRALAQIRNQPSATIQDLLNTTINNVTNFGHTPVYRAEPEAIVLNDLVFGSARATSETTNDTSTHSGIPPGTSQITPSPSPQTGGLYLALEEDQSGLAALFVSAPNDVTEVAICIGDAAACQASSRQDMTFKNALTPAEAAAPRFVSRDRKWLQPGNYTVLGFTAGKVTRIQAVALQAK